MLNIAHFTVVHLVTWPLIGSEAGWNPCFNANLTAFHKRL